MARVLLSLVFAFVTFSIAALITGSLGTMDTRRLLVIWAVVAAIGWFFQDRRAKRRARLASTGPL